MSLTSAFGNERNLSQSHRVSVYANGLNAEGRTLIENTAQPL